MTFKNITIAGGGVLGSQIAFQSAFHGFNVTLYDINEEAVESAKKRVEALKPRYERDINAQKDDLEQASSRISFTSDLKSAVANADLVIEAIPEVTDIKVDFYQKIGSYAPEHTVFATNSSTLLPSSFSDSTGRPDRFIALHFANSIWLHNTAEIMGHPGTSEETFNKLMSFAKEIGMVPIPLYKEQPGYILNSLLVPFLMSALQLLKDDVANPAAIDKTWMIGTGAPLGPMAISDGIGVTTMYNIINEQGKALNNQGLLDLAAFLKTDYIDKGKLGREVGEGFYTYPDPEFSQPDFLK